MARVATFIADDTISNLDLVYRRVDPSTGLYYDNTGVTACTVKIVNANDNTELLATTAMTYDANLGGYDYNWNFATALDGVSKIDVYFVPTRAGTVAAALAPEEKMEIFVYHVQGVFNFNGFALNGTI